MDHVAILRKSNIKKGDNLLQDIIRGKKTIESRWYVNRIAPWDRIKEGEYVYFKESGQLVKARAKVKKVLQFNNLNQKTIEYILDNFGKKISPSTSRENLLKWGRGLGKKRYCILIFLEKVEKIKPFEIDKTGYGNACAWLTAENIDQIIV